MPTTTNVSGSTPNKANNQHMQCLCWCVTNICDAMCVYEAKQTGAAVSGNNTTREHLQNYGS